MISADIKYVGVNDHEIDLFEGQYIVPNGMAYNSYVICDEKNLKINERLNEAHKRLKNTYTYYKTELKKRKVGN